jgi:hypothetical protein
MYRLCILIWLITVSGVKYFTDEPLDKFRLHERLAGISAAPVQ